jgi:hypothetical protein
METKSLNTLLVVASLAIVVGLSIAAFLSKPAMAPEQKENTTAIAALSTPAVETSTSTIKTVETNNKKKYEHHYA